MNLLSAIHAFVKVAELSSYTNAAQQLALSRTQVSKLVMQLEQHLGARLLQRTTRRIQLTEAGERYLLHARHIISELADAQAEISQSQSAMQGRLRISGPVSFGTRFLAPLVADFMCQHPALSVRLDLTDRKVDLLEEDYDLAIRIGHLQDSTLIARPLTQCQLFYCASAEYLNHHGTPTLQAELASHQGLRYRPGGPWPLADGPLDSNNGDVLVAGAEAGLGVICQPSFLVAEALREGRLLALSTEQPPPRLGIYGVYPARQHLPAKVSRFLDFVSTQWGQPPYWEPKLSPKSKQ